MTRSPAARPLVKIRRAGCVAGLVLGLLVLSTPARAAVPAGGSQPPASITAAVPVTSVYCSLGVCCGATQVIYRGHWYDRPRGYCRWFRPLTDGQIVTTTLWLAR